jgi:hypothetical protein
MAGSAPNPARERARQALLEKAQKQTQMGSPFGNCLEACIATLVGAPLDSVPDPRTRTRNPDMAARLIPLRRPMMAAWLANRYQLTMVSDEGDAPPGVLLRTQDTPLYWIASGPSNRGLGHAVIYENNQLFFDPHPSDDGIEEVVAWTVLVPLGPLWEKV